MTVANQNPPRMTAAITKIRYKKPMVAKFSRKWKAIQVHAATIAREMQSQGRVPSGSRVSTGSA
jgi:hypothetical protein